MRVVVVLQARAVSFADMAVMSEDMEGQQATGDAGGGLRRTLTCPQFGGE